MDWFVKAFIKASVVWLSVGVSLGVAMAVHPAWTIFRPAHLHINVVGFVAMMIFGVAYHVLPRFAGVPLRSRTAAGIHWYVANIGLVTMVAGFTLRSMGNTSGTPILATGGTLVAVGAYIFAWLIFQTLNGKLATRPAPPKASPPARPPLPTVSNS